MSVSIEIYGAEEAAELFFTAADKLEETVGSRLEVIGEDMVAYGQSIAPVGKTGRYQASFFFERTGSLSLTFGNNAPHAPFVEYDTAPHIIIPRNAKALHWVDDAEDVFAKWVMHPGTKGQMIVHDTKKAFIPRIVEAIHEGVREALGR